MVHSYTYEERKGERAPEETRKVEFKANSTKIHECVFAGCFHLTSAIMSNLVTIIEANAFDGCRSLTNLRLSALLQSIGERSFACCSSISILRLPPVLITIKKRAFGKCKSIQKIEPLNNSASLSLRTIESEAFEGCAPLAVFHDLPALETIGEMAFLNCSSLTDVNLGPSVKCAARDPFEVCNSFRRAGFR
mmetsp:Transcript_30581/g.35267  ORF Transcript_30581/g.35267 Transcript_30581/m.35267 type:complete len:192 (-) Transcript_30581:63-638(-)